MNLAIDIGNSFLKIGVFDNEKKLFVESYRDFDAKSLEYLLKEYKIIKAICSSVRKEDESIENMLGEAGISLHKLSHTSRLPFRSLYETPRTLGTDRIAALAFGYNKYPGRNVLLIDAGTAVTYDLLNESGVFEGGNISPGIGIRYRALNEFTGRLPLVSPDNKYDILGRNTENAIRSGVQQGLVFEINEYIRNLKKTHRNLEILMTGGDARYLSEKVEHKVSYEKDMIIEGLNYILIYNAQVY